MSLLVLALPFFVTIKLQTGLLHVLSLQWVLNERPGCYVLTGTLGNDLIYLHVEVICRLASYCFAGNTCFFKKMINVPGMYCFPGVNQEYLWEIVGDYTVFKTGICGGSAQYMNQYSLKK